jgi:hypothetical protein
VNNDQSVAEAAKLTLQCASIGREIPAPLRRFLDSPTARQDDGAHNNEHEEASWQQQK